MPPSSPKRTPGERANTEASIRSAADKVTGPPRQTRHYLPPSEILSRPEKTALAGATFSETSNSATSGFTPALPLRGAVLRATQPGGGSTGSESGGPSFDTAGTGSASTTQAPGSWWFGFGSFGWREPGSGCPARMRSCSARRSWAAHSQFRTCPSRVLALACSVIRLSTRSSCTRTRESLLIT